MKAQQIFNIGTTVFYNGDESVDGGYGKITGHVTDYLDELQLEITLEDGRTISNVSLDAFEGHSIMGNGQSPEFQLVDSWESEVDEWQGLIGDTGPYAEDNDVLQYFR